MLGNYRVSKQLGISRAVISSMELVSVKSSNAIRNLLNTRSSLIFVASCKTILTGMGRSKNCRTAFSQLDTVWVRCTSHSWADNRIRVGHLLPSLPTRGLQTSSLLQSSELPLFSESTQLKSSAMLPCEIWYERGESSAWAFIYVLKIVPCGHTSKLRALAVTRRKLCWRKELQWGLLQSLKTTL
jgi:hypothetical protein